MVMRMILKLLTLVFLTYNVEAYKILVIFPMPVRSLSILGEGVVRHLLDAGHEVTYISVYPIENAPHKNLRQIVINENLKMMENESSLNITHIMISPDVGYGVKELQEFALFNALLTFENKKVQDFLEDTKEQFDAVIADLYESELYAGLSALYDCPMIWMYSMGAHWQVLRLIDQPTNPAYTSDYLSSNVPPLTFVQRIQELWAQIYWNAIKRFITMPKEAAGYEKIFGSLFKKRGKTLPNYEEHIYNISLIFSNEHYANSNPSTPQNFRFVGGYYIETPAKPLPKDLQSLLDNAEHGVIYFSMGSTVKSKNMPKQVVEALLKMFGELKQTVIWKYEADLPNVPKYLHILKWAPQQSILAHPKCLLFITHGGLLSTIEALHFGIPTIGVPVFFDQFLNVNRAVTHGYALRVDLTFDLVKNLKSAINNMLSNNKYKEKVQELSAIYHDRPVAPGKELVHWMEHVVRTHGAKHLRSPALNVPFYQKMYLDLAATFTALIAVSAIVFKLLFYRKHNTRYVKRDQKQKWN